MHDEREASPASTREDGAARQAPERGGAARRYARRIDCDGPARDAAAPPDGRTRSTAHGPGSPSAAPTPEHGARPSGCDGER